MLEQLSCPIKREVMKDWTALYGGVRVLRVPLTFAKALVCWEKCAPRKGRFSHLKLEMVEVRGVEPLSETESTKLLRV